VCTASDQHSYALTCYEDDYLLACTRLYVCLRAHDQLQAVFAELGMEPVPTVGAPFDYNVHEAVMRQPSSEHEEVRLHYNTHYHACSLLLRRCALAVLVFVLVVGRPCSAHSTSTQ
jgi:GrpE